MISLYSVQFVQIAGQIGHCTPF